MSFVINFSKSATLLASLAVTGCLLSSASAQAKELTLLYVPLDNRPVCIDYVQQTMEAAGCKIILPPAKYIATNNKNGDPDGLWAWLATKAPKADAAVISTDSLLYGGLVASRTHHLSREQLSTRLERLHELKTTLPIKLYAFTTIMRTPRASRGRVEPPYYAQLGPDIFAYSELIDEQEQRRLTPVKQSRLAELEAKLPKAELSDWLERRELNHQINIKLTQMARNGKFHYLAIGKDDNAPLSATHMEARKLSMATFEMPAEQLQLLDGVDQLGLLLLVRAYNEMNDLKPSIYPLYSPGIGAGTLPQYSDSRLQDSVPAQIKAVGAKLVPTPASADLVLALNTPPDGEVKDSTAGDNQYFASLANKQFVTTLKEHLRTGRNVSLADISYANGADNGFMNLLAQGDALSRLAAYNGWNTADNSVGFAIAQGLMAKYMTSAERERLVKQRLIDDWFYQSNARSIVADELDKHNREEMKYELEGATKPVLAFVTDKCQSLAQSYQFTKNTQFKLSLPWNRLFEVDVDIKK